MKNIKKSVLIMLACVVLICALCFGGCVQLANGDIYVTNVSVSQTVDGTEYEITVEYSDGNNNTYRIPAAEKGDPGADGKPGEDGKPGSDGQDGEDGKDITITEIYNKYVEEYGEISYADFLKEYFSVIYDENNVGIGECLLSSLTVYTEFIEYSAVTHVYDTSMYTGSAVIWSMDDNYTYFVTNYHVTYSSGVSSVRNGGDTARKITAYLYGSELTPVKSGRDDKGYTKYEYGDYAISCEYVGGAITSDIAVIRAKTDDVLAVNENVKPVKLADGYRVGEKAVAIGNLKGMGISVNEGVISMLDDDIKLNIDGTTRTYRSIRIDTHIQHGNSGGGLFNANGELIGITNGGDENDATVNYINFAIPLEIVRGTVDNIMYYYKQGDISQRGNAYKITFGVTVTSQNQKYVYDASAGYGRIVEDVVVQSITTGSMASLAFGLKSGDVIKALYIGNTRYEIYRSTDISDAALLIRPNDIIRVEYERNGEKFVSIDNTNSAAKFTDMNKM